MKFVFSATLGTHADLRLSFLGLFILFVIAIEFNERDTINVSEFIFMVYALGFTLEKVAAMQEHGIKGEKLDVQRYTPSITWQSILQGHLGGFL